MTEDTLPWFCAGIIAALIVLMMIAFGAGYERGQTGKLRSSCEVERPGQLRAGWYRQ